MKTTYRTIGTVLALLICAGVVYTNMRIASLEDRIQAMHLALQRPSAQPARYAFNESFIEYFGVKGVEEVARAIRLQRSAPGAGLGPVLE